MLSAIVGLVAAIVGAVLYGVLEQRRITQAK